MRVTDNSIPAGGKKNIRIKIRPCIRGQHTITLNYQLVIPISGKKLLQHCELSTVNNRSVNNWGAVIVFNCVQCSIPYIECY